MERNTTIEGIGNAWIENTSHNWKESTKHRYMEKLRLYVYPKYGDRLITDVSTEEVEQYLIRLQTEGVDGRNPVGSSTACLVMTVFKQLSNYARKVGVDFKFSPECISVKREKSHIDVFSEKEEAKLIKYLKKHPSETNTAILICLFTGIRLGEICALKCDDIDLEECVLHVRRTMQRLPDAEGDNKTAIKIDKPKTACSLRDIPFTKELAKIIRPFHKPGAFFLTGDRERYVEPRTMEDRFASVLKKCGIRQVNFHVTRHTYATRCIERGMDPKTLSELLGHANVATTLDRYVHLSMKHKAESVKLIADLLR